MKLAFFPARYIETGRALPFDLCDNAGRLLLAAGQAIDAATLQHLWRWELFADEASSLAWRRSHDASLAAHYVRDGAQEGHAGGQQRQRSLGQQWSWLVSTLEAAQEAALDGPRAGPGWIRQVHAVHASARAVAGHMLQASLCHLFYLGGLHTHQYSCHQSLRCMLVAGECARLMGWDELAVEALEKAALTMNVSMRALQDMLALRSTGLSAELHEQVQQHPHASARLLVAAGVTDPVWLSAVALHHDAHNAALPLQALTPAQRAGQLLRRVDILCAKVSRRGRRPPLSGVKAVREACLGSGEHTDAIGTTLLQFVGVYPPGSFVALANGEHALVLACGRRANTPRVAVFAASDGAMLRRPQLRDTEQPEFAVHCALDASSVPERPDHEKLLTLLR